MLTQETKSILMTSRRIKLLILFVSIVLIVFMFPKGESLESEVSVGSIWIQDDLIASTTFEILKNTDTYRREKIVAAQKTYPIFVNDRDVVEKNIDSLREYNKYLLEYIDEIIFLNDEITNSTFLSPQSYQSFKNLRKLENTLSARSSRKLSEIFKVSSDVLTRIYRRGLISINYDQIEKDSISVREGKFERLVPKNKYFEESSVKNFISLYVKNKFGSNSELNNAVAEYIFHFAGPNIIYSEELTEEAKKITQDKVSKNIGFVNENERIVAKHDRITPEIKLKIDSYRIAKGEDSGFWERFAQNFGKFLHIIIIVLLYVIYIYLFRKKIYNDNVKILLIAIIVLFISALTFLVHQINVKAPMELLILIPVASMLLTIIFDSRVGFYGTVVIALIAGALRGNDYVFTLMNICAGALAAYTVRDIKHRTQIFRSFLFILIGYVVSIIAFGLERFEAPDQFLIQSAFATSNALVSPVLTYGLIIFFEKLFKITTDLTLLELTDFNTPLLKELAKNAPGTFTHSITMGSLVENAAEGIKASPILARVGAYYHDIGKSLDPESFVENQMNNKNIHTDLDPIKSAELIINHVQKGIDLAKEYKLPHDITNFIPMHHGTMVVTYFYEKLKEKLGADKVNINDFRYPGPKPNTKETALVMLADACESTVRSMSEQDPKKVENVVNNLIKYRIDDGQLDDAPLTLEDIKKIKQSFLGILIGQHHKRIRYPKQDEMENISDESR